MPADFAQDALDECLAGPPRADVVTARDVARFAQSPFSVWCDRHAPESARDPVGDFERLLLRQGREHEARLVAARFPLARRLAYGAVEEGFALVVRAMAEGAAAIHDAPLLHRGEGLEGRADLLERRDDALSRFGPWHYVVKEVKLARHVRDPHRVQARFYTHLLGLVQGHVPPVAHVVNRDGEETEVPHDADEVRAAVGAVRAIHAGLEVEPVHGTGLPPWGSYTDACAVERGDVSVVAGVGPAKRAVLAAAGIRRVRDLAARAPADLRALPGIGPVLSARLCVNARALVEGRHLRLAPVDVPAAGTEVFLDLEGTAEQAADAGVVDVDYLVGALVRRDGRERYRPFVARRPEEEGEMFARFAAWFDGLGEDVRVFHWHHYERTHLQRLADRHGLDPALRARLGASLLDLHKVATASFAFPTPGSSLKHVAPYVGFRWRHEGVDAMASIALYLAYVEDPGANRDALQRVLDYNEDDCVATRVVRDWLGREGRA